MISFLTKKTRLVDLLEGFTDIHNHILPGIDDGSKTVEESIELIKGFSQFGVQNFIMTPHIMHNYHENSPSTISAAEKLLKEKLEERDDLNNINFMSSAEHMIDSNFENILERKETMPLGKEHLLIEMSYLQPPINFDESVDSIKHHRLFPVLAHPERYSFLLNRPQRYTQFKDRGIFFQLNMLSLSEYYGKEVTKIGAKLLEEGMIDFIGSDVHHMNHLDSIKKISISKKTKTLLEPIIERTIETFSFRG